MNIHQWRPGILPRQLLQELRESVIFNCSDLDHSSIDLHLSNDAWKMNGSLRLAQDLTFEMINDDDHYVAEKIDLSSPQALHPLSTYVIKLREYFRDNHGHFLTGQATGKSSIGRLDVLTRLLVNNCDEFDTLPKDYNGSLYLEVTPITFPIIVSEGLSLNQLRLFKGQPEVSRIDSRDLPLFGKLTDSEKPDHLTLSLESTDILSKKVVAFRAKDQNTVNSKPVIDISKPTVYDPQDGWELVTASDRRDVLIQKDRFYILRSKERFQLPDDVGVYAQAITENLGEIRIHYAGFVHPGFGLHRLDKKGTPLIFEVRGHTVDAFLRQGELMAKISYYRTSQPVEFAEKEIEEMQQETYNNQELTLSKYFKPWNA